MNNSNTDTEVKITVENGVKELVIRQGKALDLEPEVKVEIKGNLDAPLRWLEARIKTLDINKIHIKVDREHKRILLITDENNAKGTVVDGELIFTDIFKNFNINTGKYISPLDLGEFIKMNRTYFESKDIAMELVTQLKSFKAKVNKQVEQDENRNTGDRKLLLDQVCEHNAPKAFNVVVPIFKGFPPQTISVETYFNPNELTCALVSPEANEFIEDISNSAIDEIIDRIKALESGLTIIEI
jgi:hypothetical protein